MAQTKAANSPTDLVRLRLEPWFRRWNMSAERKGSKRLLESEGELVINLIHDPVIGFFWAPRYLNGFQQYFMVLFLDAVAFFFPQPYRKNRTLATLRFLRHDIEPPPMTPPGKNRSRGTGSKDEAFVEVFQLVGWRVSLVGLGCFGLWKTFLQGFWGCLEDEWTGTSLYRLSLGRLRILHSAHLSSCSTGTFASGGPQLFQRWQLAFTLSRRAVPRVMYHTRCCWSSR